MRVVYLGNLLPVAEALSRMEGVELAACLFETGDREAAEFARLGRLKNFETFEVSSSSNIQTALNHLADIDLGIIANFGIILSEENLKSAKKGFINAHLGLLPENAGRYPIRQAIEKQHASTGVTLHRVTTNVDQGPILAKYLVSMGQGRSGEEIYERLVAVIPDLIQKNFQALL